MSSNWFVYLVWLTSNKLKDNYENNKEWAYNIVWLGRRVAYLGDYKRAIELFTEGVNKFPEDAQFLRHRGDRYISTRQIDEAISDFGEQAPLLTLQGKLEGNQGDFRSSILNFRKSLDY